MPDLEAHTFDSSTHGKGRWILVRSKQSSTFQDGQEYNTARRHSETLSQNRGQGGHHHENTMMIKMHGMSIL